MKPTLAVTALFAATALGALGGAFVYQIAARDRAYQDLLARGDAALRDGQTFGAIEAYSGAIALRPDSMLAHLRRGETYERRGDLADAARDFRTASELDPSATRPLEALGDVLYLRERFSRAAEMYERRLQLDDQSAEVAYKLALARYRDRNLDEALAALDAADRLSDSLPNSAYLRGVSLHDKGQLADAVAAFERAVELSPGLVPAREELVGLYTRLGRRAAAIEQLRIIAALDGARGERRVALGLAQARAGSVTAAVATLGAALERQSDQPIVYAALGRIWLEIAVAGGDRPDALPKALEALERAASTPGASSEVLTMYGRALLMDDRIETAERVLEQATQRFPVDSEAFLAYANAAERRNHPEAARDALIDYGALAGAQSGFAARAARIGALSLRVNDLVTAVVWFERAMAAAPDDLRLVVSLADAQLRNGDRAAARATVTAGLERDPQHEALLALSSRLR